MATIGEQLLQPETGWQRYKVDNTKIIYTGNFIYDDTNRGSKICYGGFQKYSTKIGDSITFYFSGNKLRLCFLQTLDRGDVGIVVNNMEQILYNLKGEQKYTTLAYNCEKLNSYNKVTITHISGMYMALECIDIDKNGVLLTKEEYDKLTSINYLIKENSIYKNLSEDKSNLIEISSDDISSILENKNGIIDLNDIVPFIPTLSKNWSLISNKKNKISIQGIKSDKEMITTLEPLNMRAYDVIHNITGDYVIENNGVIKFIFSFDKGSTWKTYDVNNSEWNDVNVDIPIRLYENFSDTDKTNWNTARDTILSDGISVQDLGNVDFQSVKTNKLMFAVAFNRTAYSNTCTLKGLNINYDGLETYTQLGCGSNLSSYEAKVTITGDEVGVTTSSNQDKILVTMTTNI